MTSTVKLVSHAPVGVPEMTPVEVFRLAHAGNAPLLMLHVYGAVPPVAARVAE